MKQYKSLLILIKINKHVLLISYLSDNATIVIRQTNLSKTMQVLKKYFNISYSIVFSISKNHSNQTQLNE